jgi:hypothetical protein
MSSNNKTARQTLGKLEGIRLRCRARLERFGTKRAYRGEPLVTLLLRDVVRVDTGNALTDHLWFTAGKWSAHLKVGDVFEFDARVSSYIKGYLGHREDVYMPPTQDWRLERPTAVKIVSIDNKYNLISNEKKLKIINQ